MSNENNTQAVNTEATGTAAPEVKKTRLEKLTESYNKKKASYDKLAAELTEIVNEVNAINALGSIDVGSKVVISIGKGESAKDVEGTVIGVREDEDGAKQFKVAYGSGFDADVKVVGSTKLRLPTAQAEAPAAD